MLRLWRLQNLQNSPSNAIQPRTSPWKPAIDTQNMQRPLYLLFNTQNIIEPYTLCLPIISLHNIIQFNVVS